MRVYLLALAAVLSRASAAPLGKQVRVFRKLTVCHNKTPTQTSFLSYTGQFSLILSLSTGLRERKLTEHEEHVAKVAHSASAVEDQVGKQPDE